MNRNIQNQNLETESKIQNFLQDFINQLAEKLQKMEEMLVVDRIENDISICEDKIIGYN